MSGASLLAAEPALFAIALTFIRSPQVSVQVNAIGASLLFLLCCAAAWWWPIDSDRLHLVLLTSFVAMTTSWYGDFGGMPLRRNHLAYQIFVGSLVFALLAGTVALSWVALAIAMGAAGAMAGEAHSRLLLLAGVGLMLALLGMLLLRVVPGIAGACLILGFGAVGGLMPFHAWLANVATDGPTPAAIVVTTLPVNVTLLVFLHLHTDSSPGVLMALGLVSLLTGAALLFATTDHRRMVAFGGLAQLGMIVFAIGLGDAAARVGIALLALLRAAALQSECAIAAWIAFGVLPLFLFYLFAGAAATISVWLLLPLGVGAVLTGYGVLARLPQPAAARQLERAPMWLQLAVVALLAFAMPRQLFDWFASVAR